MSPQRRPHRRNYNTPGHAHVLTFSCYHRFRFLLADRTCQWLADTINFARREYDFALWAYVFMPDHAHLLVYPQRTDYDIAAIRHAIKYPVGERALRFLEREAPQWLPRITRQRGDKTERLFWQSGGGYDRNIDNLRTLMCEIDYIHLNPVRRGLVQRAVEWKWSNAGWFWENPMNSLATDKIPLEWIA